MADVKEFDEVTRKKLEGLEKVKAVIAKKYEQKFDKGRVELTEERINELLEEVLPVFLKNNVKVSIVKRIEQSTQQGMLVFGGLTTELSFTMTPVDKNGNTGTLADFTEEEAKTWADNTKEQMRIIEEFREG